MHLKQTRPLSVCREICLVIRSSVALLPATTQYIRLWHVPSGKLCAENTVNSGHFVCYDPDSSFPVIGIDEWRQKQTILKVGTKLGTDLMFTMMVMQRLDIRGSTVV